MGYSNVLLTISAIAISAVMIVSMQTRSTEADGELASYHHQTEAREYSQTAFNVVKRKLYKSTDWSTLDSLTVDTTAFRNGEYSVATPGYTIDPSGEEKLVFTITGRNGPAEHTIVANYRRKKTVITELPAALQYAILADKNIEIRNTTETWGDSLSNNANVHANEDLFLDGDLGVMKVEGFGTYNGSFSGSDAYLNPNNPGTYSDFQFPAPEVDIPELDVALLESVATVVTDGDVDILGSDSIDMSNFQGVTGYGTAENPYIWLIKGDVFINAWVKFIGHSVIVATGNIDIHDCSKVTCTTSFPPSNGSAIDMRNWTSTNLPDGNQLAMYAKGDFTMADWAVAVSQIYSENDISFTGSEQEYANVVGSIISKGDVNMLGKFQTWYWPLSLNLLTHPWDTEEDIIELSDFTEYSTN